MTALSTPTIFAIAAIIWVAVMALWLGPRIRRRSNGRLDQSEADRPETLFQVILGAHTVTCIRPDGTVESFSWDSLDSIEILTTGDGPFLPDVFWVFRDREGGGAVIPAGADGFDPLMERSLDLEGFDHLCFIDSQGSTSEATFPVWKS